jgi:ABC-type branched-subunit amino acid transport system substrate-binding protein
LVPVPPSCCKPNWSAIGIEVKETLYSANATPTRDFTNLVLRIKAIKPDIVIMSNYQNEYVLIARTMHQQKVDVAGMFSVLGWRLQLQAGAKSSPTWRST